MPLVLKDPFREVSINGRNNTIDLKNAPLNDVRQAIDVNKPVGLRDVMYGMSRLMHYPVFTTSYDMDMFVKPTFAALLNDIENGRVEAFTMPNNSHYWEEQYVRASVLLAYFDTPAMPSSGEGFERMSQRGANTQNPEARDFLDFRRAFLIAIGDAVSHEKSLEQGKIIVYSKRTPAEWEAHYKALERLAEKRKPITDGMMVYPAAMRFHAWLVKNGLSHDPNTEEDEPPLEPSNDDEISDHDDHDHSAEP